MSLVERITLGVFLFLCLIFELLLRTDPDWNRPWVIVQYAGLFAGFVWLILKILQLSIMAVRR